MWGERRDCRSRRSRPVWRCGRKECSGSGEVWRRIDTSRYIAHPLPSGVFFVLRYYPSFSFCVRLTIPFFLLPSTLRSGCARKANRAGFQRTFHVRGQLWGSTYKTDPPGPPVTTEIHESKEVKFATLMQSRRHGTRKTTRGYAIVVFPDDFNIHYCKRDKYTQENPAGIAIYIYIVIQRRRK